LLEFDESILQNGDISEIRQHFATTSGLSSFPHFKRLELAVHTSAIWAKSFRMDTAPDVQDLRIFGF
jgi:hypothetical protein